MLDADARAEGGRQPLHGRRLRVRRVPVVAVSTTVLVATSTYQPWMDPVPPSEACRSNRRTMVSSRVLLSSTPLRDRAALDRGTIALGIEGRDDEPPLGIEEGAARASAEAALDLVTSVVEGLLPTESPGRFAHRDALLRRERRGCVGIEATDRGRGRAGRHRRGCRGRAGVGARCGAAREHACESQGMRRSNGVEWCASLLVPFTWPRRFGAPPARWRTGAEGYVRNRSCRTCANAHGSRWSNRVVAGCRRRQYRSCNQSVARRGVEPMSLLVPTVIEQSPAASGPSTSTPGC